MVLIQLICDILFFNIIGFKKQIQYRTNFPTSKYGHLYIIIIIYNCIGL